MGDLMNTLVDSRPIAAPGKKQLSLPPAEIMKLKIIADVQLSPKNDSVLFVATEAVMDDDKSVNISRIYKTAGHGNPVLFSSADVSSTQPRWSPDGKWVAFLAVSDGIKNLFLIPSDGGEATPLTTVKKDVQNFAWSPDSQKIAFVMTDETELEKNRKKTSAAYVYKQATSVNRLWVIDVFSPGYAIRALTPDEYCVRGCGDFGTISVEFDWSPDGKSIVFAHSPGLGFDYFYLDSSLATLDIFTGKITPWRKQAPFEATPRYSPDGQWVAYLSSDSPERYAVNRQVAIRSKDGTSFKLLALTFNEGPFLSAQNLLGWTKDGGSVLFFEPKGTKYHIVALSIDGTTHRELETGDCFFKDPNLSPDRTMLGFVAQAPASPPEAYISKLDGFQPLPLSNFNRSFLAHPQLKTEVVRWESSDGLKIEGLLTYPLNYQRGKKYPFLLVIHGGPMGFFDETFLGTPYPYPLASFAEAGFVVFRPNPRGSCGYGKTFRCANYNDWGGMDYNDIITGVDALIAKGIADPDKMGVMGWSYGGYMTAWTIGQTSRFKAASMGAGLSNLVSMDGTTDLDRFFLDYLGSYPDRMEFYQKRSPINYIRNVTTPCLIQHGIEDKRVPVSQAYEFYHALERAGKKPLLVLYPEMAHRITDPKMLRDAMESNLKWFQHHLL